MTERGPVTRAEAAEARVAELDEMLQVSEEHTRHWEDDANRYRQAIERAVEELQERADAALEMRDKAREDGDAIAAAVHAEACRANSSAAQLLRDLTAEGAPPIDAIRHQERERMREAVLSDDFIEAVLHGLEVEGWEIEHPPDEGSAEDARAAFTAALDAAKGEGDE